MKKYIQSNLMFFIIFCLVAAGFLLLFFRDLSNKPSPPPLRPTKPVVQKADSPALPPVPKGRPMNQVLPIEIISDSCCPDWGVEGGVCGAVIGSPPVSYGYAGSPGMFDRYRSFNTEEYHHISENRFLNTLGNPVSTFSIDVDTASYTNVRRYLSNGTHPPKDAVRIEEMINYFTYDYPQWEEDHPFSIFTENGVCPWNKNHRILHIGIQGKIIEQKNLTPSNLVFLMDVSGSMEAPNKLPLLKSCFLLLADQLKAHDKVAIVVYAGAAGLILPSTAGNNKPVIKEAIDRLSAGGSTAGGQGIRLAYHIAELGFIKGGNNRIILATDGDFNIGVSSTSELVRLVEEKRRTGIYLTVLGFGTGNLKDSRMESLADRGNGNYFYIDNILEGKKVFVDEMTATLYTIARDVKIQAEFNPALVKAYRLIGYENRLLEKEDFNDDTKDAGELGSGHTVTALYEWIPAGSKEEIPETDPLKFQETRIKAGALKSREIAWVKLRYKKPDEDQSRLITHVLTSHSPEIHSDNFYFSTAVALWGMLLRDSPHKNNGTYQGVMDLAERGKGKDTNGYRKDFIHLVRKSHQLAMKQMAANAAVSIRMVP